MERKKHTDYLEYLWVSILVIYCAKAVKFAQTFQNFDNLVALIIPVIVLTVLVRKYGVYKWRQYLTVLLFYVIYFIAVTIKYRTIHPQFFLANFLSLTIAYFTITILKERFFYIYEDIVFKLSLVALFFWGMLVVIPNTIASLLKLLSFETGYGIVDSSILIYTIGINFRESVIPRNSGFAWEPGVFSCFVALAILINLIRNKFTIRRNAKLFILTLTVLTTQSTTGYSILLILLMLVLYNKNLKYTFLLYPMFLVLCIFISTLSFMGDKIADTAKDNIDGILTNSIANDTYEVPQRFDAIKIDFVDFLSNPILGYGGHFEDRWTIKLGANIASTSGLGRLIASLGSVGILFFLYCTYLSSYTWSILFHYKGTMFLLLVILGIAISYTIIFDPLLMCFWMFGFYYSENIKKMQNSV